MKSKLIALLTCKLCKIEFEIDLAYTIKSVDSGLILSHLKCMNCQSECTIDIMRVQKNPCSGYYHIKHDYCKCFKI
jgi:hypothetical protein